MTILKIDVHVHTAASFDCAVHPADVVAQAKQQGLDRICITDHNRIDGARLAQQIDPELVIIGEEIRTTHGEILAFFLKEWVPPRLSPAETLAALTEQGAVISLAHPFDPYRAHWSEELITAMLPHIDALEGLNARSVQRQINRRAVVFAGQVGLPVTAGSDAHTLGEIGQAYLAMPAFDDAESFRASLQHATMEGSLSHEWVKLVSTFNNIRNRIGLKPTI